MSNKKLFFGFLFTILLIIHSAIALTSERIYFLNIEYYKGELKLINVSLITGFPALSSDATLPYKAELLSVNNDILYEGHIFESTNVNFSISLPYQKNGNLIRITKDEKELLSIDVSQFSKYCGDFICQYYEDEQNCAQDCAILKDGQMPKEELLSEHDEQLVTEQSETSLYWLYAALPILLIFAFLAYVEIKRRHFHHELKQQKAQQNIQALKNYVITNLKRGFSRQQIINTLLQNGYTKQEIEEILKGI